MPALSIEERLVARTGSDVRDVVGRTAYALATPRDTHTPFAGGATGSLLQSTYDAFRAEGACLSGCGASRTLD